MPKQEPLRTTPGSEEYLSGVMPVYLPNSVLRSDVDAALRFAELVQSNAEHLALLRWTAISFAVASMAAFVSLLPFVIGKFVLSPTLIGVLAGFLSVALVSTIATLSLQRRLRTELRALYKAAQMLHEVAGTQNSEMSPIQRELLSLRLSRLDYGSPRGRYAMR